MENLAIILKVLELETKALLDKTKTTQEFIDDFLEDEDIAKHRKEALEILGLDENCNDLELINKTYKDKAKAAHPDMPGGDVETFKALNKAHKLLKKELVR